MREDPYKVLEVRCDTSQKDSSKAKDLLERVAKQVQPVMRKHSWTVPLLSELSSKNGRLWGLNIGGGGGKTQEIKLRLRESGSRSSFLSYDFILGTMLHELVHNVHGPHNAAFYALLDKINDELDEFIAKGITGTGQGFDAPSVGRLGAGGFGGHNPSSADLRRKMIQAAEARARTGTLMPNGPRRLGGAQRGMTPQQAAADAAERRAQDDIGCACGLRSGTDFSNEKIVVIEHGQQGVGSESNETFQQEGKKTEHRESQKCKTEADAIEDVVDLTIDSDSDSVQEMA
ncbi:probable DNA-dependent metalloprotease WSS1 [Coccomyxa sp. Obi]|nr:probable DNA-dependent metalloprotease WSS1 [Coccomyxa sp. Obi]